MTPLGERSRNSNYIVTLSSFIVGAVAGGAVLGLLTGSVTSVVGTSAVGHRELVLSMFAVWACVVDSGVSPRLRVPTHGRQVRERWFRMYRGWVYGGGFGLQLGVGYATVINSSLTYLATAAAILSGSIAGSLVIGIVFGISRAVALLPTIWIQNSHDLMRMTALLHRSEVIARRAATSIAGFTAAALAIYTFV